MNKKDKSKDIIKAIISIGTCISTCKNIKRLNFDSKLGKTLAFVSGIIVTEAFNNEVVYKWIDKVLK